jgi:hypothetical protein
MVAGRTTPIFSKHTTVHHEELIALSGKKFEDYEIPSEFLKDSLVGVPWQTKSTNNKLSLDLGI